VATTAVVLKVVDGDTVDITDDVRGRLRIRLLGSDTPETHKPGYTVGCWGPEASEFAKETLLGQRVAFATDPSQGTQYAVADGHPAPSGGSPVSEGGWVRDEQVATMIDMRRR
jgi:endonuclease YncB( thermonuclease family)